jgi:2'-5' RNA ligase
MARLFVGLRIGLDEAHELHRWTYRAVSNQPLRLIEARNLHVTMTFCGEVPDERVVEVCDIVDEEAPADLRWRLDPLGVRVMGGVLALTYTSTPQLADVQRRIDRRLVAEGLAEDEHRRWLAHVTVARARRGIKPRVPAADPPLIRLAGEEVAVFESALSPKGAEYAVIASSPRRHVA